jgi:hypothetical protein
VTAEVDQAELLETAATASEQLARARRLLCEPSPRQLDLCCSALNSAQQSLRTLQQEAVEHYSGSRSLAAIARHLRGELDAITILLERAARYHADLLEQMLAASQAPPSPDPTPVAPRLHVEG